jgi:hypothetical protein
MKKKTLNIRKRERESIKAKIKARSLKKKLRVEKRWRWMKSSRGIQKKAKGIIRESGRREKK